MKIRLFILSLLIVLYSCNKKNSTEKNQEIPYEDVDGYTISTINGIDSDTKEKIELEVYKSVLTKKKFLNQAKRYIKTEIDSSNSKFFVLEYRKNNQGRIRGEIYVVINKKKIFEIELKLITFSKKGGDKIVSFKSSNSNKVVFDLPNTNSLTSIKGVLYVKLESNVIVDNKVVKGYYYSDYMFVDNEKITDNPFIKKHKKE